VNDLLSDLLALKKEIDKSIGQMQMRYGVANVSTFWIYTDISEYDDEMGSASDHADFFDAIAEYMDVIELLKKGNSFTNVQLVAALTTRQHIILHQLGDFDPEPDEDNEKAHRDWRTRQGVPDCT